MHSVFTHAVNLLFDGQLVTLLAEPRSLVPYGCTFSKDVSFPAYGLVPGMAAVLMPEGVETGGQTFLWRDAVQTELSADAAPYTAQPETVSRSIGILRDLLAEEGETLGLSPLVTGNAPNVYSRFLQPRLQRLTESVRRGDGADAIAASAACAGCGMGLTPSSDDLLTGYFAALYVLSGAGRTADLRPFLPDMAEAAAAKTNLISGAFLTESARGLVSQDFLILLQCIFSGAPERAISNAAARVASFGSTSGRDMLTGLVLAIQHHNGGKNCG